jgi:hypothetical protein
MPRAILRPSLSDVFYLEKHLATEVRVPSSALMRPRADGCGVRTYHVMILTSIQMLKIFLQEKAVEATKQKEEKT